MTALRRLLRRPQTLLVAAALVAAAGAAIPTVHGANDQPPDDLAPLLNQVVVVSTIADIPGYDRSCIRGRGCVFGHAWTDDTDAPMSHNGCTTRNDVLKSQLTQVKTTVRSHGCKVVAGRLDPDPYTGKVIDSLGKIEIDHIVSLKRSWDSGAYRWDIRRRATLANDPANLLAVDSRANSSKGSKSLAQWRPPNAAFACQYARRYLTVARNYQLPITRADRDTAIASCR